jgi:hypothetical protein
MKIVGKILLTIVLVMVAAMIKALAIPGWGLIMGACAIAIYWLWTKKNEERLTPEQKEAQLQATQEAANELAQKYATKSDDELLDLHSAGTLTGVAYEVLEAELKGRGVPIPQRHEASAGKQGRPRSLAAHWHGQASLASAYWLFGVLGGSVFLVLFWLVGSNPLVLVIFLAWIPYTVFALVSIWRCAWNTSWKGWGYIARVIVILNVLMILAELGSVLE